MASASRVVLVVGGSGGVGGAITSALAKRAGTTVYSTHFRAQSDSARGENVTSLACDLREPRSIYAVRDHILKAQGRLDAVINCATSPLKLKRFEQMSADELRQDVETILLGGLYLAEAVLPAMKQQRSGTLLYLLSQAGQTLPARMSTYAAAKAGLAAFVGSLAKEVAAHGIRVIGISPSLVETGLIKGFPEKMLELERGRNPGGKLAQPSELAERVIEMLDSGEKFPGGTIESFR